MRNIMDNAFVEYFTDQALALQGQESNELPALRRQLADTEKAIDNMLNAIQAGIFNASTKRRLDELEATKEKLELRIIKEEMKKPQFTREQIQFYILQFRKVDTNTLEGRKRLIDGFVNSVVVYDDYILVTFNYKEGAEQITFEQIERSDLSSIGGPKTRHFHLKMAGFSCFFTKIKFQSRARKYRRRIFDFITGGMLRFTGSIPPFCLCGSGFAITPAALSLARAAFFTMGHGWEPSASPLIKKGCALPSTMLSQKAPPILPTFCGSWRSPGMRSSMGAAV